MKYIPNKTSIQKEFLKLKKQNLILEFIMFLIIF